MILTGDQIIKEVKNGNIYIDNFMREKVNPNSYNLTLKDTLMVYTIDEYDENGTFYLDSKKSNNTKTITIPEDGYVLQPGTLYLGRTNERTITKNLAPMLDGRSSIGRLGMAIHITAGFGDVGFDGTWTLEIAVQHPLRIYPNMEICQISYLPVCGEVKHTYNGKYQNQSDINPSKLFKEYE